MCGGLSVSGDRYSNWSSHRMERMVIKMIKAVVGFLRWALLHMVIGPCIHRYLEKPTVNLILRVFGFGDQDHGVPSQDVERGEAPADRDV